MLSPEKHVCESMAPLVQALNEFARSQSDLDRWRLCVAWPVEVVTELTTRVLTLRPKGIGEDSGDRLVASLITRYIFEMTANLGVMLRTTPEEVREQRQIAWRRMQQMTPRADGTYALPVSHLSEPVMRRLDKRAAKLVAVRPPGSSDPGALTKAVSVTEGGFRFDDPWQMGMLDKAKCLPLSDEAYFLDRWKMYAHISHASAFSIWFRWIDPVPRFDAVECLAIVGGMAAELVSMPFDPKSFRETTWKLSQAKPASPKQAD